MYTPKEEAMGQAKITFIGDIMCEPMLLKAAKVPGGFDFRPLFQNVKGMFADSDYVIGNLETPLAGKEAGYTNALLCFNAPDEFADAIKDAGIDLVSTANNHCFDRGIQGLLRTMRVLEEKQIPYCGTTADASDSKISYFTINDTKFALISYTYGTNFSMNKVQLDEHANRMVNLLRPQEELYFIPPKTRYTLYERFVRHLIRRFNEEKRFYLRKLFGLRVNEAHPDDSLDQETAAPYVKQLQKDICEAKTRADVVLFYPHMGGQFNLEPGIFSEYMAESAVDAGCNAVIASHAHVVLEGRYVQSVPCFFSLGNFSMSPNSIYLIREGLPEYGLAVHLYYEGCKLEKVTFSILKILEDHKHIMTVMPVDALYKKMTNAHEKDALIRDIQHIYRTVTKQDSANFQIQDEYIFPC